MIWFGLIGGLVGWWVGFWVGKVFFALRVGPGRCFLRVLESLGLVFAVWGMWFFVSFEEFWRVFGSFGVAWFDLLVGFQWGFGG